jgi:hypothetical protein
MVTDRLKKLARQVTVLQMSDEGQVTPVDLFRKKSSRVGNMLLSWMPGCLPKSCLPKCCLLKCCCGCCS